MYIKSLEQIKISETEDYIFINKPPFISTLADRHDRITILSLAKSYNEECQICHRLDKETSGVLLIAKNHEAYRNAAIQFERRKVKKVYHAIVDGLHAFEEKVIDLPLHITSSGYVKISHKLGKSAKTIVDTKEIFKIHSLIECQPESGRMHQIRVHLASLKASIVGDEAYGGQPLLLSRFKKKFNLAKDEIEQPLMKRFALHAVSLSFTGLNGEMINENAEYPADFAVALKQLRKNQ